MTNNPKKKEKTIRLIAEDTIQQKKTSRQLKQSKEELRKSEAHLKEAETIANTGNFDYLIPKNKICWSDELYRIFGYEPQSFEVQLDTHFEQTHPDDQVMLQGYIDRMKVEKKGFSFGYRIVHPNQEVRYVQDARGVELNNNGKVVRIFGTIQDVTEQKRREKDLLIKDKAISSSPLPIVFADLANKFTYANQAFLDLWGYDTMSEILGQSIFSFGKDQEQLKNIIQTIRTTGQWVGEYTAQKKDGTSIDIYLSTNLVKDEDGTPICSLLTFIDMTAQKKASRRLETLNIELEEKVANRTKDLLESKAKLRVTLAKEQELGVLKSRFVSMASHEFRTPLSSILSSAELLGMYIEAEKLEKTGKNIDRIKNSVRNLTSILNDFLSLEKLEAGKVALKTKDIHLLEYLEELSEGFKSILRPAQQLLFEFKGIHTIQTDPYLLKNILINLISNAIKYSPNGEDITLEITKAKKQLFFKVIDKGIGIPEEDKAQMFSRFFRASNVENIQGTGIGLTIVKRYLELMGGTIDFESEYGKGSTFLIKIPQ